jgi:hypothetical protein
LTARAAAGTISESVTPQTRQRRTDLYLFVFLFFCAAYFRHPLEYDNSRSRFFLLSAVVDDGTLAIDRNADETVDASREGGHVYSNKAIGAPLAASPVYYALRHWTPIRGDAPLSPRARYLVILTVCALPFALAGVALRRVALGLGASPAAALDASLAYGLGTLAWLHASLFSGHQLAASAAFLSFAVLRAPEKGRKRAALAGALAGLAVLSDYTALIAVAGLTVYACSQKSSVAEKSCYLSGLVVLFLPWPIYNALCFGSPWTVSYARLSYPAFAAGAGTGVFGFGLPRLVPLLQLLFSPARGLFFTMPVLLLAPTGVWTLRRKHPRETVLLSGVCAVYAVALSGFYGWHGGWAFGPRYLVPMLPFLALPIAFSPDRRWLAPLLALSCLQVGFAQAGVPDVSEWVRNPIPETIYPLFHYGYAAVGWGQAVGLSAAGSVALFAMLAIAGVAFLSRESRESSPARGFAARDWPYACALGAIVVALLCVRTPAEIHVRSFNARLLRDAARDLPSPALNTAARLEDDR